MDVVFLTRNKKKKAEKTQKAKKVNEIGTNRDNRKYCPHCWPTRRKSHFVLHLEYYLTELVSPLIKLTRHLGLTKKRLFLNCLWGLILESLALLRIFKFSTEPDEAQLRNRSLIFFKEAKRRGLEIKAVQCLGRYINEFKFSYRNKRYYYEGIPLMMNRSPFDIDNKHRVRTLFQKNNIPVAPGALFVSERKAIRFAERIGYPLVVKPNGGSLSHHITCFINSTDELTKAIRIAKTYRPDFIVERHIEGDLYRASIVGQQQVFTCKKERANIVGDGFSTIEELIKIKNSDRKRGETEQKNTTLHKIPIDGLLFGDLKAQGLKMKSVLPKNKKLYLRGKYTLSCGCDIINCTEDVHIDNKELFVKVSKLLKVNLVGIDFICPDIKKSYKEQETAVLEANSLPYIDMHQEPSHGKADAVAEIVWNIVLNNLNR